MQVAEEEKQAMSGSNDLFVFVHIPKTAGMTFRKILDRQFTPARIYKIGPDFQGSIDRLKALPEEQKARITCISGHVPYGIHHSFGARPVHYLSFVRDPVDRAVSEYFYFRKRRELLPLIGLEATAPFTPQDYLQHVEKMGMGDFQTRILTNHGNMIDGVLPPYQQIPEEMKGELLDDLQHKYALLGSVALFDESLLLMQQQFGWRSIRYIRRNVARADPKKSALQHSMRNEIRRLNPLDCKLYEMTTAHLGGCITAGGDEFAKQLQNYRLMNRCYSWLWRVYRSSGLRKIRMAMMKT